MQTEITKWLLSSSSIVASSLLLLKLAEMVGHAFVLWRVPRNLVDRLGEAVASGLKPGELLEECRPVWDPAQWMFTRRVLGFPSMLRRPAKLAFRWPVLMTAQALLLLIGRQRAIVELGCFSLVAGVWLELGQRFVFRLRFGYLDTYIRKASADFLNMESKPVFDAAHHLDLVVDFVLLFGRLVLMVITGYAAVYSAIELTLAPGAFRGEIGQGVTVVLSMLYFSVVTVATVGYGDITPVTVGARLLVASEIMAGFLLLVLLITAFAFTTFPSRGKNGAGS